MLPLHDGVYKFGRFLFINNESAELALQIHSIILEIKFNLISIQLTLIIRFASADNEIASYIPNHPPY